MSEKEKDILERLSNKVQKLDDKKQNYILGVVEGMVIAEASSDKAEKEPAE